MKAFQLHDDCVSNCDETTTSSDHESAAARSVRFVNVSTKQNPAISTKVDSVLGTQTY